MRLVASRDLQPRELRRRVDAFADGAAERLAGVIAAPAWVDRCGTGLADITGDQGLLGQVNGRTSAVIDWLAGQDPDWRSQITHVAIDL